MAEVLADNNNQRFRIVQITDSHLFSDRATIFDGINTFDTLSDVVAMVKEQQEHIDCLLCTGDLAQDSAVQSYLNFREAVSSIDAPQIWLPGNHDIRSHMQQALDKNSISLQHSFQLGRWRLIMLDSSVEGSVYGMLDDNELAMLDMELADCAREDCFALVCVHHNCLPVEAAWLQQHSLRNSEAMFAILDNYPCVKGILYGHIHQQFDSSRNGVKVMASPSTCIQFHPSNNDFKIDDVNPGYRWLDLCPDGEIESEVKRIEEKSYNIDFSSTGY